MGGEPGDLQPVGLVMLAAGGSARLGRPKQLLPYGGRSLLRHAAEMAVASVCRPITVVLGAHAAELTGELRDLPVQVVENPYWSEGMGGSLRVGLETLTAISSRMGAVVIALCDQPLLSAGTIDALVRAHRERLRPLVASEYGGVLGAPALFSRALFGELMGLKRGSGAREIIGRRRGEVWGVPFPGGLIDIDTPDDYEQLRASTENSDTPGRRLAHPGSSLGRPGKPGEDLEPREREGPA
jgi:molybdenum cofactor cytidylyltransferase